MKRKNFKLISISIFLIFSSTLFACSGKNNKKDNSPTPTFISVSGDEAKKMMDNSKDYIILDVRQESEYNEFHIEGAIVIPDYEIENKAESILKDKDQTIFVYCRSGRRSKNAARDLVKLGYTNIIEMGGVIDWHYGFITD